MRRFNRLGGFWCFSGRGALWYFNECFKFEMEWDVSRGGLASFIGLGGKGWFNGFGVVSMFGCLSGRIGF